MKSVLISIQPKWCELIASGIKTVEVRKSKPKLETPFKAYIYQTKIQWVYSALRKMGLNDLVNKLALGTGKVIGEFVCDKMFDIYEFSGSRFWLNETLVKATCLTEKEINDYGKGKDVFGWHISNLVIYDKPKELGEFITPTDCNSKIAKDMLCNTCCLSANFCSKKPKRITRPPQSWSYVESEADNGE